MNDCTFIGHFTRDPQLGATKSGTPVLNFSLGVTRRYKTNGETREETVFPEFEAWDTHAQTLASYCKKGSPILIYSTFKVDEKVDGEGKKVRYPKFRVDGFEFLPKNTPNMERNEEGSEQEAGVASDSGDVPF